MYNDPQYRRGRCVFAVEVSVDLVKYVCKLGTDCRCFLSAASLCSRARRRFVHSDSPEHEPLFFGRTVFDESFALIKSRKRSNALVLSVSLMFASFRLQNIDERTKEHDHTWPKQNDQIFIEIIHFQKKT